LPGQGTDEQERGGDDLGRGGCFHEESTKSKWAGLAKLVGGLRDATPGQGAKERVEEIAADLVEHYETRTSVLEGKARIKCRVISEQRRWGAGRSQPLIALSGVMAGARRVVTRDFPERSFAS